MTVTPRASTPGRSSPRTDRRRHRIPRSCAYDSRGYQTGTIAAPSRARSKRATRRHVSLTVPAPRPRPTLPRLSPEAANHLGEALTRIRPDGPDALFVQPFGAEDATEFTASRNADGQFRVPVYADTHPAAALETAP